MDSLLPSEMEWHSPEFLSGAPLVWRASGAGLLESCTEAAGTAAGAGPAGLPGPPSHPGSVISG